MSAEGKSTSPDKPPLGRLMPADGPLSSLSVFGPLTLDFPFPPNLGSLNPVIPITILKHKTNS